LHTSGRIVGARKVPGVLTLGARPAPPPPRRADRPLTPRRFVLSQDLRFLVRSFVHPLRDVNLLPSDDMSAIFCNVEQLLELHEGLVAEIAAACGGGGGGGGGGGQPLPLQQTADVLRRIADAFARRMAFFKLYSMYCSNFVFSSSRLSCVRETLPAVQQLLTEVEGQYQTTALGLMIRPVQRVCQYPLLFREVLKHLQNDDPGAADFARMVGQMEETIETVNEKVRAQENGLRMRGILTAELQGAGLADLISPSRALVHEAIVRLRAEGSLRPEWRAKREYKIYVFSDLLLIARANLTNKLYSLKLKSKHRSRPPPLPSPHHPLVLRCPAES
jgi:hypothetical protein